MSPVKVNVKGKVKLTVNVKVKVKVVECSAIEEWQSKVEECSCKPTAGQIFGKSRPRAICFVILGVLKVQSWEKQVYLNLLFLIKRA